VRCCKVQAHGRVRRKRRRGVLPEAEEQGQEVVALHPRVAGPVSVLHFRGPSNLHGSHPAPLRRCAIPLLAAAGRGEAGNRRQQANFSSRSPEIPALQLSSNNLRSRPSLGDARCVVPIPPSLSSIPKHLGAPMQATPRRCVLGIHTPCSTSQRPSCAFLRKLLCKKLFRRCCGAQQR